MQSIARMPNARATEVMEDLQQFFADEMKRRVGKPITFEIARDGDGDLLFDVKFGECFQFSLRLSVCEEIVITLTTQRVCSNKEV